MMNEKKHDINDLNMFVVNGNWLHVQGDYNGGKNK